MGGANGRGEHLGVQTEARPPTMGEKNSTPSHGVVNGAGRGWSEGSQDLMDLDLASIYSTKKKINPLATGVVNGAGGEGGK